ncbi:MAG: 4-hydroxythreonine-4-phosphate dehydrogenase PdxA [Longimicrobiales bacterium]|nr:4-hydroxythreonine-4-phosphate dehydrogenase PdxA [Longimicrobiales bacterium]
MTSSSPPPDRSAIAVTLGDPRGIGPEVSFRAAARLAQEDPTIQFIFIGPGELLRSAPPHHATLAVEGWDGTEAGAGRASALAIEAAVSRALSGDVGAVVTAPVHKPALHHAGWRFPGQTELLQHLAGAAVVGMLMAAETTRLGGALRVLLATTHLALRDVPTAVTRELLIRQTSLLHRSLKSDWGIAEPRIALCALNPHASDQGLFGDEEERVFAPALAALRALGVDASPPLPADTVFGRALSGAFDAVVAPYHDVGMAAFKTASFGAGVNVTLGLPFIRTSPDHGTAFDLASHPGKADCSSMLEALRLARRLAKARFDRDLAGV